MLLFSEVNEFGGYSYFCKLGEGYIQKHDTIYISNGALGQTPRFKSLSLLKEYLNQAYEDKLKILRELVNV